MGSVQISSYGRCVDTESPKHSRPFIRQESAGSRSNIACLLGAYLNTAPP